MRYVFISHASDDNPRLAPYIHRLLQELDEDTGLWIDTPEHIDHELGRHPRIKAIPPGQDWDEHIARAVNSSECVLAFWSKNAVKRERAVLEREIDRGRKRD